MVRLAWSKIANDIQSFGSGFEVGVSKGVAVCHRKIGPGHFEDNDAYFWIASSNRRGGKIAWGNIVIIPETEVDRLATRKELPHLGCKNAKVGAGIRGGLRSRMPGQNVQDTHAETTILALLAPHPRRGVHQWCEGAIGAAQGPDPGELRRVKRGTLAHQSNGRGSIAGFLDRRLKARPNRVRLWIVVAPQAAMFDVNGLREVRRQSDKPIVRDVIHPLDDF